MKITNVKKEYEESFGIFSEKEIQDAFDALLKAGYFTKYGNNSDYKINEKKLKQMIQEIEKMN